MKLLNLVLASLLGCACQSTQFDSPLPTMDLQRFMGTWYVLAGRFTYFEGKPYNAIERYTYDSAKNIIDTDFSFNEEASNGPIKKIPQYAWVPDPNRATRWKVRPFWPLAFDYLVLYLDPAYKATAIGVPSGNYLWVMARSPLSKAEIDGIISKVALLGYPTQSIYYVEHNQVAPEP